MSKDRTLLFIYGTLKTGASNHAVLADQEFIAAVNTIPGSRLYVVADYPGVVKDPTDKHGVQGELWSVDNDALARLDAFEGLPEKLYRRDRVTLASPHESTVVETYYYLRTSRGRRPIISGNWPTDGRLVS